MFTLAGIVTAVAAESVWLQIAIAAATAAATTTATRIVEKVLD